MTRSTHILLGLTLAVSLLQPKTVFADEQFGDTVKVNDYSARAISFLPQTPDSAFFWYDQATKALGTKAWPKKYFELLLQINDYYESKSDFEGALPYMHHILNNYPKHKNARFQLIAFRSMAMNYAYRGELEKALIHFKKEKRFLDSCVQVDPAYFCDQHTHHYSSLGIAYAIAERKTEALEQFMVGDSLAEACGSFEIKALMKYCLGSIMTELNRPRQSLNHFKTLENWVERGEVEYDMTATYDNMVISYMQLKHYDTAKRYLNKALKIARRNGDSISVAYNHQYRAEIAWETGNWKQAADLFQVSENLFLANKAMLSFHNTRLKRWTCSLENGYFNNNTAIELDSLQSFYEQSQRNIDLATVFKLRSTYFALNKQYQEAFRLYRRYDSLQTINLEASQQNKLAELQAQYETVAHQREAEKQSAIAAMKQKEAESKTQVIWILAGTAGILLIALVALIILFRNLKSSRKVVALQKAGIEKKEKEKSLLLKELHHRVKNNLQIVSSLLNLQRQNAKDEAAKGAFKEGQNRVEAMALIHRYLYATDELTKLELDQYLRQLVQSIAFSYGYNKADVRLNFDISETPVDADLAIPLGLIANELVSNVFKHAFQELNDPEITVKLNYSDVLSLTIADNGPGIPTFNQSSEGKSFGMDLIQTLCSQLKADLSYHYHQGAVIQLNIPINHTEKRHEDTAA